MKKNTFADKFTTWILQYCNDNNITAESFTDENEAIIKAKVKEVTNSSFDVRSFECGIIVSAVLLNRDALITMKSAMK